MLRRTLPGYLASLAAVASITAALALIDDQVEIANLSMLYLLAVIGVALKFGQNTAVFASVVSFLAFNFFFVEPRYTMSVANASEWVALFLFLVTATITGQLTARQRLRAIEAEQRERETALLYDLARLMNTVDSRSGFEAVAARLREELSLAAVGIEIEGSATIEPASIEAGEPGALPVLRAAAVAPSRLLLEGATPTAESRGGAGRWIRAVPSKGALQGRGEERRPELVPLRAANQRVGNLVLVRSPNAAPSSPGEPRLLAAVAAQIGAALEMERLRNEATEAEALRRADELKTALLNAVSHDLRTPLASIIASAGSLLQSDIDWTDAERRDFAQGIETQSQRLNLLVGNLLDLSRIESGSLRPDKAWYDLGALIGEVVGRLKPEFASRSLRIEIPDDLPPIELDYIEIDEVLTNLLENAVKYSPAGSEIDLRVVRSADRVTVSVADRGQGVPDAALRRIFEPFFRVPGTGAKGAGLGLAVAKGLVEAHGGTLSAMNRNDGGAEFSFTLPISDNGRVVAEEQA